MDKTQLQNFARKISKETDPSKNQDLIPAATVVLLRDGTDGMETLMLRKNSKIAFAGMWVFPGGRIDVEDGTDNEDMEQRARIAAAREASAGNKPCQYVLVFPLDSAGTGQPPFRNLVLCCSGACG